MCLDADVSATVINKKGRNTRCDPAYFGAHFDSRGEDPWLSLTRKDGGEVESVDFALKELHKKNKNKHERRPQGQGGRHVRPHGKTNTSMLASSGTDETRWGDHNGGEQEDRADAVPGEEEQSSDQEARTEGTDSSSSDLCVLATERDHRLERLALAASVSMLDGLLHGQAEKAQSSRKPPVATTDDDECARNLCSSPDQEARREGRHASVFRAVQRLGVPLLMIQSTEDAVIETPLPLVLQREVGCNTNVEGGWGLK